MMFVSLFLTFSSTDFFPNNILFNIHIGFQVITALTLKCTISWVVTLYNLGKFDVSAEDITSILRVEDKGDVSLKHCAFSRLHCVTMQENVLFRQTIRTS